MSNLEIDLEKKKNDLQEKKLAFFDAILKRIVGILAMFPYLCIGFIEAYTKVKFNQDFKQNMMYFGLIGLFTFFSSEINQIYNLFKPKK